MKNILKITPLILLAWYSLSSCNSHEDVPAAQQKAVKVTLSVPKSFSGERIIQVSGTVQSKRSAQISTRVMGTVTGVEVELGSRVKKGQLLFTINASDLQAKEGQVNAQIALAKSALANAQKDYERYQILFDKNSATGKELENMRLNYESAKAQLESAKQTKEEVKANMQYARMTAPFEGTITQKMIHVGDLAHPGVPAMQLEGSGDLEIAVTVSENNISAIKVGTTASVYLPSIHEETTGKVTQISTSSSSSGGRFMIKIDFPQQLRQKAFSGMTAQVSFREASSIEDSRTDLYIPESALIYRDELVGVYTLSSQNTALLRWIRTGRKAEGKVEIISGLSPKESYILHADGRLYNGIPVITE